jgi:twitching motility protein PilT
MELFQKILKVAVDGGASDIHLKIGTPVILRSNRQLIAIECPSPTKEWMDMVVKTITPKHQFERLEREREVDFSYHFPHVGRFRTNLYQQRGEWCLAMRYVKAVVPSFEELGLLPQIKKIAELPRGIVLLSGTTGSGKSTTLAAMIEHITAISKSTSSRSRTPSNTFLRTTSASSSSAKSAWTRCPSTTRSNTSCARTRTSSWWAKCATPRASPPP